MTNISYTIFNMSVSASILVLVVLVLRLMTKKVPKWINVLLWGLVAFRLICPFTVESRLSLMPETDFVPKSSPFVENSYDEDFVPDKIDTDTILEGVSGSNVTIEQNYPEISDPQVEIRRGISVDFLLSCIWLAGTSVMILYMGISYLLVHRRIRGALHLRENIYQIENVSSPFVFGIVKPRICLPMGMDETTANYVIAHEKAHIRRLDHWWKPVGFLLLAVHWFNPLIWLSYILLCRDIELACDERVIREMGAGERADYSEALLASSGNRRTITACPLAFGEISIKERIKSVLNYKKPSFWLVILAVCACVAAGVFFLTDPVRDKVSEKNEAETVTAYLNSYERTKITEGNNDTEEEKKLYVKFVSTEGPEKAELALTIKPNIFLTLTESFGTLSVGETKFFSIPENSSYTLEAYYSEGVNGNVVFEISEMIPKSLEENNEIIPPYVIDTSYDLACEAAPCSIDKNIHVIRIISQWYNELLFHASDRELYVGVKWEHTGEAAEWTLLPENAVTVYEHQDLALPKLTLDDVIELSQREAKLSWSDFAFFAHTDVQTLPPMWEFEIDENYHLNIGCGQGGSLESEPWHITLYFNGEKIDIREKDVEAFIAENKKNAGVTEGTDEENKNLLDRDVVLEAIETLLDRYIVLEYEVLECLAHSKEPITVDGKPYYQVTDSRFDTWAEFEEFFASIYSGDELQNQLEAISELYINVDGNTWVTPFGRGNLLSSDYRYEFAKTGEVTGMLYLIRTGSDGSENRTAFEVVMISTGELRITASQETAAVMEITDEEIEGLLARFRIWEGIVPYDTPMISNEKKIIDGEYYHKVIDEKYDTWEEFVAFLGSLYIGDELAEQLDRAAKSYMNLDGETWVIAHGAGHPVSLDYRYEYSRTGDNTWDVRMIRRDLFSATDDITAFEVVKLAPGELRINDYLG